MKRIWDYGTSTPIQRVGIIILGVGLISLFSWMIKEGISFDDLFEPYYLPGSRDSLFFHLFFYLIPLGLLMSWGYQILVEIKRWVFKEQNQKTINPTNEIKREIPKQQTGTNTPNRKNLHFKNNLAAFKYASENYIATMDGNTMSIGIIQDIILQKDNNRAFLVQIANKDKTILVAGFNDKYAEKITKGNLVYWGFVDTATNDPDISAVGRVLATLHPELNPNNGKWIVKNNLSA